MTYRGAQDARPQSRLVEPHGLLLGIRRYLIARPSGGDGVMRRFRLDRIEDAEITGNSFRREPDVRPVRSRRTGPWGRAMPSPSSARWPGASHPTRPRRRGSSSSTPAHADDGRARRLGHRPVRSQAICGWPGTCINGATASRCSSRLPCATSSKAGSAATSPPCPDTPARRERQIDEKPSRREPHHRFGTPRIEMHTWLGVPPDRHATSVPAAG